MKKITLPHPELIKPFLQRMRIVENVSHDFDGLVLNYSIYDWDGEDDPIGLYDEDGNIFISRKLYSAYHQYADLVAYHETKEIEYKRDDTEHDEAHRRAYVVELKRAREFYNDIEDLKKFLEWRLSIYSDEKIPNKKKALDRLVLLVTRNPYPAEQIYEAVKDLKL